MDLSVVIVSWNTRDLLARCLTSVIGQRVNGRLDIWVVDNGSSDSSAEMVRDRFASVRLIENDRNLGFAAANNQALRRSEGRYVVLLNSDTVVGEGALLALVDFLEAHPLAAAVGPRLLNADGSLQASCHPMLTPGREFWRLLFLDGLWPRATYRMDGWDTTEPRQVEVLKGACLLLRREALEQVGLLDEVFFMYSEEVDLCYRLALAGWQVWWAPEARVLHYDGQSARQAPVEMFAQLYASKVKFFRKHWGEGRASGFKVLIHVAYWPRLAVAALAALVSDRFATRRRSYRRLLAELPGM